MKKLMIAVMVAGAAVMANASNLKWGITATGSSLDYTTEGQEGLKDGTLYLVFLSNTAGAYKDATAATAAIPSISDFKTVNGVFTEKSITDAGGIIFREADLANGHYYSATAESVVKYNNQTGKFYGYLVAIGSDGESLALSTSAQEFNIANNATPVNRSWEGGTEFSYTTAVPEPTSGLLLLLGVAGLALRRRRA